MDLLPFIKEQVKMLARTLPENIEISLEANEIATVVEADPTRLQQALFNLSMNARDAMPEGGKLGIRVIAIPKDQAIPCVTCGQVTGGQWICIEVEDSGTGISPATLPHIFEPFFTTKPPGQGTGLGLAQVFGIAKSHNGHIYVRSEAGQGSTFGLYLPAIKHERRSELSTPSSQLPQGMGQSLVVVEDEEVMRAALVDTLTLIHYKVIAFPNGEQTLAYLRQHEAEVDLILSDVVMPEMGGIQLMRTIRKRGWTMPFILMTGHAMEDELERLRDEGLTDYILKPPRVQDLARIISNAMKKDAAQ
jgi:CheY-like chemotaxis protein